MVLPGFAQVQTVLLSVSHMVVVTLKEHTIRSNVLAVGRPVKRLNALPAGNT
jgi:hypothetical protein